LFSKKANFNKKEQKCELQKKYNLDQSDGYLIYCYQTEAKD